MRERGLPYTGSLPKWQHFPGAAAGSELDTEQPGLLVLQHGTWTPTLDPKLFKDT